MFTFAIEIFCLCGLGQTVYFFFLTSESTVIYGYMIFMTIAFGIFAVYWNPMKHSFYSPTVWMRKSIVCDNITVCIICIIPGLIIGGIELDTLLAQNKSIIELITTARDFISVFISVFLCFLMLVLNCIQYLYLAPRTLTRSNP